MSIFRHLKTQSISLPIVNSLIDEIKSKKRPFYNLIVLTVSLCTMVLGVLYSSQTIDHNEEYETYLISINNPRKTKNNVTYKDVEKNDKYNLSIILNVFNCSFYLISGFTAFYISKCWALNIELSALYHYQRFLLTCSKYRFGK